MTKVLKNILCFCILVVIIFLIVWGAVQTLKPDYPEVKQWDTYIVKSGDTLWGIVPRDDHYDIRDIIDMTIEHNNLKSVNLQINDTIEIPVLEEVS